MVPRTLVELVSPPQNLREDIALIANEKLRRNLLSGVALAILAGLLALFAIPNYRLGEPSLTGKAGARFRVNALDGKVDAPERLARQSGGSEFLGVVVPAMRRRGAGDECAARENFAGRGATILGISVDDDNTAYEDFLKQYAVNFPTYRDTTKGIAENYGTRMYPETYIIDREGRIDRKLIGPQDWTSAEMMAYFDTLLAKK
jgi:cytochrome c biogenesis protein CcmG/thiol:disulfide interchange protein DsbE